MKLLIPDINPPGSPRSQRSRPSTLGPARLGLQQQDVVPPEFSCDGAE